LGSPRVGRRAADRSEVPTSPLPQFLSRNTSQPALIQRPLLDNSLRSRSVCQQPTAFLALATDWRPTRHPIRLDPRTNLRNRTPEARRPHSPNGSPHDDDLGGRFSRRNSLPRRVLPGIADRPGELLRSECLVRNDRTSSLPARIHSSESHIQTSKTELACRTWGGRKIGPHACCPNQMGSHSLDPRLRRSFEQDLALFYRARNSRQLMVPPVFCQVPVWAAHQALVDAAAGCNPWGPLSRSLAFSRVCVPSSFG